MMKVYRRIIDVKNGERIESLEIRKGDEMVYYSYNYKIRKEKVWKLYIRWDNYQNQPHIDRYDENENHVESIPSREKNLKEILEVVDIFGKNLISMDLSRV